jgi:hypothetical protein
MIITSFDLAIKSNQLLSPNQQFTWEINGRLGNPLPNSQVVRSSGSTGTRNC